MRSELVKRRARTEAALGMGRPLRSCLLSGTAQDPAALKAVESDVLAAANATALELVPRPADDEAERFTAEIAAAEA